MTSMNPSSRNKRKHVGTAARVAIAVSASAFVLCLLFPAFTTVGKDGAATARGFQVLLLGWAGLPLLIVEWCANPLLLASWWFAWRGNFRRAFNASGTALLLATGFLLRPAIIEDMAPNYASITARGPGYWLWLASIFVAFAAATYGAIAGGSNNSSKPTPLRGAA